MVRRTILLVALFAAPGVRAQDSPATLAAPGQVVLSAERLFGFAYSARSIDGTTSLPPFEETGTTFGPLQASASTAPFAVPRLALDVFLGRRVSLGGAISYVRATSRQEAIGLPNISLEPTTDDVFVLAPRIGYLAPLSRPVSLWPRVGFTYLLAHRTRPPIEFATNGARETFSYYALTIEVPVAIRIVDHIVATAGPTLDLGLRGVAERRAEAAPFVPNRPTKEIDVGFACGLAGYF